MWNNLANEQTIETTIAALKENGIDAITAENGEDAKKKVLELLPKGAEVMDMTSVTLDTIGVSEAINKPGEYNAVKSALMKLDREKDHLEMQKLGAAPEWAVGSVHAVTEDGKVVVASFTGSQLPAYAYGSAHVIWVVGTQKIVKNLDDAMKRINDHVLPLETTRARKAYHAPEFNSHVSKILIVDKEIVPKRITIVFVKEQLGF